MTYQIVALPEGVSAEEWCNQTYDSDMDDEDIVHKTNLVDDLVFDRERLASWCGLEREDWVD